MDFDSPLQAIREGLQFAPVEIRKAAVPALDAVERMIEYSTEHFPDLARKEAVWLNSGDRID